MVTEPLNASQMESVGWKNRQGLSDYANQFHYYRLTSDNRILWGGYDAIYYFRGKVNPLFDQRPETFATLSRHFFETFPQLEGLNFTHVWGGAIDTCTRFTVFWGKALSGRVAYAAGYTGLGVAAARFGGEVMLDLLDGRKTRATQLDFVRRKADTFSTRALPIPGHPGNPVFPWSRGPNGQTQSLAPRLLDRLGLGFDS